MLPLNEERNYKKNIYRFSPVNTSKIISITGPRRAGKTYLMFQTIKNLLNKNVNIEDILYINFEDDRLDFSNFEFDVILQSYIELYPERDIKNCYLFFDEIQMINNWERFIRRVYDTITKNIFITGANSKLISKEIASSLRGRTITFEIFPLNFSEFLRFKNIKPDFYHSKTKAKIMHLFSEFLFYGGFPEIALLNERKEIKIKILQEYFNVMIYRDIIERYNIKQITLLKFFIKRVFEQITSPISINKIFNDVKSQGYKISKDKLYEFADYIESIFLGIFIKKYSSSILKSEFSSKKFYSIDNGILNAITFKFNQDFGKLFENFIFLEFKKAGHEVYYFKNKKECDFLILKNGEIIPIQVCYDIENRETLEREIASLLATMDYFKRNIGYIITPEQENFLKIKNKEIKIIPFYKVITLIDKLHLN